MEQEIEPEKWIDVLCPKCGSVIHKLNFLAVVEFTIHDFVHSCGFAGNVNWKRNVSAAVPEHQESTCHILDISE